MLLLVMMAWQDWKYRAISLWLFVLVGAGLVFLKYEAQGLSVLWEDLKINLVFLVLQFVLLFGYFAIRQRRFVNLFAGYFGEGDLFFLVLLATYLSFANFLVFYVGSLVLVVVLGFYMRKQNPKIPLAGAQALLLALAMGIDGLLPAVDLTENFWLLSFYNL
ncbi:hypothetical protein [Pedobacter helvus]|uniref:Prepilin type IV endopeptidase peptidase domain-containing protein n=1 Tax=Pedobacter helvus TaxID=2563444 RepID=A0ABW9JKS5_9SPHI|nr:hypothetical protein [Pedobacter ureilyticus]